MSRDLAAGNRAPAPAPARGDDAFFVLAKMGRLPSWHLLTDEERLIAERHHVDLMLSIASRYGMRRLEGYRLMGQQHDWQRFWVIEFPTLEGAEAWIEAEMQPPYGLYGFYEYDIARSWAVENLATWPTFPRSPEAPVAGDPRQRSYELGPDLSSVVVLLFGRGRPGYEAAGPVTRGDDEHVRWMQDVARDHRMIRIEAFQPIARRWEWHRAWVIEFPDLAGAEACMATEVLPPHGAWSSKQFLLARRWAPDYFASWVPRGI